MCHPTRYIKLQRQRGSLEIQHTSITLQEAKQSLKAEDEEYHCLKVNAPIMQQDFLQDWMQDSTLSEKVRKHAKQSLKQEWAWDNAHRMKHMQGEWWAMAVSKVSTGQGDNYQEYEDQSMVKWLIMANNSVCFCSRKRLHPWWNPYSQTLGTWQRQEQWNRFWTALTFVHLALMKTEETFYEFWNILST